MASFEYVTARGVIVPDTEEIQREVVEEWRAAFGQDLDVGPETPQGVLISAEVESRDSVARNNAALANQINPDIAGGVFLDALWSLTGGGRRYATRSLVRDVLLTGQRGAILPAGALAAVDGSGELFALVGSVTLPEGGTALGNFQALKTGPIAAPAGMLTKIVTGTLGWETISNATDAVLGRVDESDIASRARRRNTLALQGVSLNEAITSRLYDTEGVRSLKYRENYDSEEHVIDGVLLKPHSIYACIDGGTDADIARALLETKSMGCGYNGAVSVDTVDQVSGQIYTVQFDRPEVVALFVRVTARPNGLNIQSIIPQAITDYADGLLEGGDSFGVGQSVSPFELAGAVNQVEPRIFVSKVELSTDGEAWASDEVAIGIWQIAAVSLSAIQVVPV